MEDRREDEGGDDEEDQASVQRKHSGEDLSRARSDFANGAHATQEHRGVLERVDPREPGDPVVACHPQQQGCEHEDGRPHGLRGEVAKKVPA